MAKGYEDDRYRLEKPTTFLGFIDELRKLWKAAGKDGVIVRDTPTIKDLELPAITYHIKKRIPHPDFKEIKPRERDTIKHPHIPGEFIQLMGQFFLVFVEFKFYSTSAEQADEMMQDLEEFLYIYAGHFQKNGVQRLLFHEQGEDEVISDARFSIAKRSIIYKMSFEKINTIFLNQFEQIAVQAGLIHKED